MPLTLSERVLSIAPSVTTELDARAKALRAQGLDVISFCPGEPDFDTPDYICEAGRNAIDRGHTRYTPVVGTLTLRTRICEKLLRDNAVRYTPEQIIVSGGAKQSLFTALQVLLEPGDEVLIPSPCWVSYTEMVKLAGGVPVLVPGRPEDGFVVTADMLRPHVTQRTKALLLNTPNNPNGCIWNEEALTGIAALAIEKGFYVISDEVYEKLIYDGERHVCIASLSEEIRAQTIVVNGVSKAYAMTGWRIGYAAGPTRIIRAMAAFQSHATSCTNAIAQQAAAEALASSDDRIGYMLTEYDARRRLVCELIAGIDGISCPTPKGAFYVMANISALKGRSYRGRVIGSSGELAALLLEEKLVAVVPGAAFFDDDYVRICYASSREQLREGFARIRAFVDELDA